MATIDGKSFHLDSSLELAADSFTLDVPGTQDYREAAETDVVRLKAGFTDAATGLHYEVGQVVGPADAYEISIDPKEMTCRVSGRDSMAELIGRRFAKRYLRAQPTPEEQAAMDGHTFADEPDPIVYAVGSFNASEIAREVVAFCGLSLSWECRDYTLLEDFDASGRCLDILKRLIEPWCQVDRCRVDLFAEGDTIAARPRQSPMVSGWSYPWNHAGIKHVTVRRQIGKRYGRVSLFGKLVPKGLTDGGGGIYQPSELEETSVSETKDEADNVLQRVVRTTTYRMPEKIVLRSREQTFDRQGGALKLVKDEQRENEWETIPYTDARASKNPRQLRASTLVAGIHPNDKAKIFQHIRREDVSFSYETEGYQDMTTTRTWELNLTKRQLAETERVVRVLKEIEHLKTEEVTSTYKAKTSGEFYLAHMQTNESAGLRPGGPRPGRTITIGSGDTGTQEPLTLEAVVSDHVWAEDVQYSNPNLEQEDLDWILAQMQAASGQWEYSLAIDYVAMPWIRKGDVIEITGLTAEDGVTPIQIGPALIVTQGLNYDESSTAPQMVSRLSAVWWG